MGRRVIAIACRTKRTKPVESFVIVCSCTADSEMYRRTPTNAARPDSVFDDCRIVCALRSTSANVVCDRRYKYARGTHLRTYSTHYADDRCRLLRSRSLVLDI